MSNETKHIPDKLWPQFNYPLTHVEALGTLTKKELVDLGQRMLLSGLSKYKKEELVQRIAESYADNIWPIIRLWDRSRYKLLKQIVNNGGIWEKPLLEIQQYDYFREIGLLFPSTFDGSHVLILPDELLMFFKQEDLAKSNSLMDRNAEWIRLTKGLLNFYGALTTDQITEFVIRYAENKLAPFDMINVLIDASLYYEEINLNDSGVLYDARAINPNEIIAVQKSRTELDFRNLTKSDIWRAGETGYIEKSSAFINLVKYVTYNYEMDIDDAEFMVDLITDAAKNGQPLAAMVEIAQDFVELPDLHIMNEITGLIVTLYNDTKQWLLKGNSPNELRRKKQLHEGIASGDGRLAPVIDMKSKLKVGRNDPCTCGSGKKFKKCCGQANSV